MFLDVSSSTGPSISGIQLTYVQLVSCLVANGIEGSFQKVENVIPADPPGTKTSSKWRLQISFDKETK